MRVHGLPKAPGTGGRDQIEHEAIVPWRWASFQVESSWIEQYEFFEIDRIEHGMFKLWVASRNFCRLGMRWSIHVNVGWFKRLKMVSVKVDIGSLYFEQDRNNYLWVSSVRRYLVTGNEWWWWWWWWLGKEPCLENKVVPGIGKA